MEFGVKEDSLRHAARDICAAGWIIDGRVHPVTLSLGSPWESSVLRLSAQVGRRIHT